MMYYCFFQDDVVPRKEKRQYKKRKHKTDSRGGSLEDNGVRGGTGSGGGRGNRPGVLGGGLDPLLSSDEDSSLPSHSHPQPSVPSDRDDEDTTDEGQFTFRRNRNSTYLPVSAVEFSHVFIFYVQFLIETNVNQISCGLETGLLFNFAQAVVNHGCQ